MDPTWKKEILRFEIYLFQNPDLISIVPTKLLASPHEGGGVEGHPGEPGILQPG